MQAWTILLMSPTYTAKRRIPLFWRNLYFCHPKEILRRLRMAAWYLSSSRMWGSFYGSELRLWKKNILAPLCHPRECGDPTLQGSNLKFWKKNSRIYILANECDGDRFDPRIREDDTNWGGNDKVHTNYSS